MAFSNLPALPSSASEFKGWTWSQYEPYFNDLASRSLTANNVSEWLADWTALSDMLQETYSRLAVATSQNTADQEARQNYFNFLDNLMPPAQAAEQSMKQKLLESGLQPANFDVSLRNIRNEAEIFREENIPLFTEESKLGTQYDEIIGAQAVTWDGKEQTLTQIQGLMVQSPDRATREQMWRLRAQRQLTDREALNDLWVKFLDLRRQEAANAGFSNYREFRWRQLGRFDYTPDDCKQFHDAIEEVIVPAATRIYQRTGRHLKVPTVRPWDLAKDNIHPLSQHPLHPFETITELEDKTAVMFNQVDPQFGTYFATMRQEKLLDLENRKNKAPGAYCTAFPVLQRPFIFENAIGVHDDVQTLLHEAGHAFHDFEMSKLPYTQQRQVNIEFAEVASMGMELLASPYLPASEGGFYSQHDAAIALTEHLESLIVFWPYMAVVDAFQHWVYENQEAASDPANCDKRWAELWRRFIPGVDWSGLEQEEMTGWHRKLHIFQLPFYYVEYGLAQLGAVQVWRNALQDQAGAVANYRRALGLGSTVPLPQLYVAAGAKFAFDVQTLHALIDLIETRIDALQSV